MIEFSVDTPAREILVDVTSQVQEAVANMDVGSGVAQVFVLHTTAGITINEGADPSVARDVVTKLADLIPHHGDYRHGEGNSDAHIKTCLLYTSDAADDLLCVDLGGRRIIKKKKKNNKKI